MNTEYEIWADGKLISSTYNRLEAIAILAKAKDDELIEVYEVTRKPLFS